MDDSDVQRWMKGKAKTMARRGRNEWGTRRIERRRNHRQQKAKRMANTKYRAMAELKAALKARSRVQEKGKTNET